MCHYDATRANPRASVGMLIRSVFAEMSKMRIVSEGMRGRIRHGFPHGVQQGIMTMNKRTWVLLLSALVAGLMISPAWNWAG